MSPVLKLTEEEREKRIQLVKEYNNFQPQGLKKRQEFVKLKGIKTSYLNACLTWSKYKASKTIETTIDSKLSFVPVVEKTTNVESKDFVVLIGKVRIELCANSSAATLTELFKALGAVNAL